MGNMLFLRPCAYINSVLTPARDLLMKWNVFCLSERKYTIYRTCIVKVKSRGGKCGEKPAAMLDQFFWSPSFSETRSCSGDIDTHMFVQTKFHVMGYDSSVVNKEKQANKINRIANWIDIWKSKCSNL